MNEKYEQLKALIAEVQDLNHAAAALSWDQQTYMPDGGTEDRGNSLATIEKIAHQKFTSDEVGKLLVDLKKDAESLDPDSEEYRVIKVTSRDFDIATRVPADFVAETAQVTSASQQAWVEARKKSDFSIFRPHLEKVVELNQRYVTFFPPADHPYDVVLDRFEPGMKTADVKAIFDALRPQQVKLVKAIAAKPQVDDSFLHLEYDEKKMLLLSEEIATAFGYDFTRGRQDKSAHPFTTNFGPDDVRITTRFVPDQPFSLLFSTMHEVGHALYEQGVGRTWTRTAVEGGASLAIHESQSRMWENLVGRSRAFWEYIYPRACDLFPEQLGNVSLDEFYKGINKVEPSLIRVEADEATYNLHIMLRLEMEIGMLEGKMPVKDLPEIWNAKMHDYLGITPPNDAKGVLQDVHWSHGMLGYFSTYALGNLISVQLWERFKTYAPDLDDQIRKGEFSGLLSWLRVKIHQYGRKYEPQELVERVTKSKIDPEPYVKYLTAKFGEIYEL
jgi:carboxypeptidase Taq